MEPPSAGQEVNVGGTQKKKASKRPSDEDYALLQDYFEDVPRKKGLHERTSAWHWWLWASVPSHGARNGKEN